MLFATHEQTFKEIIPSEIARVEKDKYHTTSLILDSVFQKITDEDKLVVAIGSG